MDFLSQGCTSFHSVGEEVIADIHKVIGIRVAVHLGGIIGPLENMIKSMDLSSRNKKNPSVCIHK